MSPVSRRESPLPRIDPHERPLRRYKNKQIQLINLDFASQTMLPRLFSTFRGYAFLRAKVPKTENYPEYQMKESSRSTRSPN